MSRKIQASLRNSAILHCEILSFKAHSCNTTLLYRETVYVNGDYLVAGVVVKGAITVRRRFLPTRIRF